MQSKNKKTMTASERRHVALVKELPCAVCDKAGPSEAHEIKQGHYFTSIALSVDCHRGPNGIHGDKALWKIYKMDELDALNETLRRLA